MIRITIDLPEEIANYYEEIGKANSMNRKKQIEFELTDKVTSLLLADKSQPCDV